MTIGETAEFHCPHCAVEFAVTYEPNAAKLCTADELDEMTTAPVVCCPFCRGAIREDE